MKRLYYLTDNIDVAEHVSERLHDQGITDWNFHVLGRDKAKLVHHHLHSTNPLQELDIIRLGEMGVLVGFAVGILVTGYITLFTEFGATLNWMGQAGAIILFSLFGAWVGGLVGVSTENYKIRRFHRDIDEGCYLMMVDVSPDQRDAVEKVIEDFPNIRRGGEDTTFIHPFAKPATR